MARPRIFTEEEAVQRCAKRRTILNWKKQYGLQVPIDLFDEFKRNKKIYVHCLMMNKTLNPVLLQKIDEANPPPEILYCFKTA
jgi:hypothetical protein